ncbi:hypothetical protein B296_00026485 [Ensete ventricosum]|uniref:Uncharacterized protein n=1 Tax=Ensete ventricosum TaxID=4639 RepID=A0A426XV24_ENSVE|nr:hypothetical protein B296_00026485 [Ensete ventricosum]
MSHHDSVPPACTNLSTSVRNGASGVARIYVTGIPTSGRQPKLHLSQRSPDKLLYGGLIEVGVSDVTPPTFKSRADHTLGLTSVVRLGMVGRCGLSLSVRSTWCRGMVRHSSLIGSLWSLRCHDRQVIVLSFRPGPTPVGSTWDLGAIVNC